MLKKRLGGDRKYGKKFVDYLSRIKRRDWKNDRKSFDFGRIIKKNVAIPDNSQRKKDNNSAKKRVHYMLFSDSRNKK
jgi:hypothetical protein